MAFGLGHALLLEREGDVVDDLHVGIEGIGLEHHADVAVLGRQIGDIPVIEVDGAAGGFQQAGNTVEGRGLAAAGRAEQGNEAALIKGEIDAVQSDNTLIKLLAEIFNTDHIPLPPEMVPCMS